MKILDRYILRTLVGPFLLGLLLTTGFLFTQVLRNYLDDFLAKGIAPWTIAEVFLLSLGHTLALSIPMAVLVSVLMAFGQLANDNELTAMKASGIGLYRIMAPAVIAGGLLSIFMIFFNDRILPESNHRLAGLITDIGRKKPTVNIRREVFIDDFAGFQLLIGDKEDDSDIILEVTVSRLHPDRSPDLIVAPRGRLEYFDGGNTLAIHLFDGEMHEVPIADTPGEDNYRVTRFSEHTVFIHDIGDQLKRSDRKHRSDREKSVAMLIAGIEDKEARIQHLQQQVHEQSSRRMLEKMQMLSRTTRADYFDKHVAPRKNRIAAGAEDRLATNARMEKSATTSYERQIRSEWVEVHKKYAIPIACLVFVLLGVPLAVGSGHSGTTMAASLSIASFTVYYLFLTGGESLADRQMLPAWLAMWAANIVFGTMGLVLTVRSNRETMRVPWYRLNPRNWLRWRQQRPPAAEAP
jgi:lipopolysaccharide export system permease protein